MSVPIFLRCNRPFEMPRQDSNSTQYYYLQSYILGDSAELAIAEMMRTWYIILAHTKKSDSIHPTDFGNLVLYWAVLYKEYSTLNFRGCLHRPGKFLWFALVDFWIDRD